MSEPLIHDRTGDAEPGEIQPLPAARRPRQSPTRRVTAAVVCGFLLLDLGGCDSAGNDPSRALLCGALIAEASLIAFWAVFGPGNLVVRLPSALLLAMATWYAVVVGEWLSALRGSIPRSLATDVGAGILLIVAVAHVPFWVAKRVFRWQLVQGADDPSPSPRGPWQFRLRHLLLATFLVAVALSPLRSVLGLLTAHRLPGNEIAGEIIGLLLKSLVLGIVYGIVCNLVVTVPCADVGPAGPDVARYCRRFHGPGRCGGGRANRQLGERPRN